MHPFAHLDVILLPSGCMIFTGNRCLRWTNLVFRIVYIFVTVVIAVMHVNSAIVLGGRRPILKLLHFSSTLFHWCFVVVLMRSRGRMAESLSRGLSDLSSEQRTVLERQSLRCFLAYLLIRLVDVSAAVVHVYSTPASLMHTVSHVLKEWRETTPWLVAGALIYCFFVRVIRLREESFFARLWLHEEASAATGGKSDATDWAHERWLLDSERKDLLSTLSLTPVLWFAHIILQTSAAVMDAVDSSNTKAERVTTLLPLASQSLVLLFLVCLCDSTTRFLRQESSRFSAQAARTQRLEQLRPLLKQLKHSSRREFTASSFFDLNRRFLLSFASSLVTFTVLFIQIASHIKNP